MDYAEPFLRKNVFGNSGRSFKVDELLVAELMIARWLWSQFDLLMPELQSWLQQKQVEQKKDHDTSRNLQCFVSGDKVYIKNYSRTTPKVDSRCGPQLIWPCIQ